MTESICHFIPYHKDYHSIHTIHFVLETQQQIYKALKTETVYKMYFVSSGEGLLHTRGRVQKIKKGDIFFTFPAFPFCIESIDDFSYMYVSFIGARGNQIMEKLGVNVDKFFFPDFEEVGDFWKEGIKTKQQFGDIMSESVLLYTFAALGNKMLDVEKSAKKENNASLLIKKYVDDNFSDTEFSLDKIADYLLYNKKYISTLFKKDFGVGISEYVSTIRIQHACALIEQGYANIGHIAFCCGYNDPQYFSRVFRQTYKMSPSEYIKQRKKNK